MVPRNTTAVGRYGVPDVENEMNFISITNTENVCACFFRVFVRWHRRIGQLSVPKSN